MASSASPVLTPAVGSPRISTDGTPLYRSSLGDPSPHLAPANAQNGTICPAELRTYQSVRSCGNMRDGASPWMNTRLTRPRSIKSSTNCDPQAADSVLLMSVMVTPKTLALSQPTFHC